MGLIKVQVDTKDILGMQNELKKIINYLEYIKQDVLSEREIKTHLSHCFQGEYEDTCKYLDDENCPANPKFAKSENKETKISTHKEFQKAVDKSGLRGYEFKESSEANK